MIYSIAETIKNTIQGAYIEKRGGIVFPMLTESYSEDNKVIEKVFPVTQNPSVQTCNKSDYIDFIPNDKLRSLLYFELNSNKVVETTNYENKFNASITLVFWINHKLNYKYYNITTYLKDIIKKIPKTLNPFQDIYNIQIDIDTVKIRDKSIFNKYTYKEEHLQYMLYPFDFGSIDLNVEYTLNNCLEEIIHSTSIC